MLSARCGQCSGVAGLAHTAEPNTFVRTVAMLQYFFYNGNMEGRDAIKAFAALAQEHRLRVFRLLVRHAPQGLPAGQIAAQMGVPASTMSAHLAHLERAGLLRSWREQRYIFYAVDTEGMRAVVTFLLDECCGGRPELCGYRIAASACQGQEEIPGGMMVRPGETR